MFAYAYDRHQSVDNDQRKVLREVLVEAMIDWLIRRHPDAAGAMFSAARLKAPGRLVAIGRQTMVERDGRRTDIELEFERGRAIVELKVGAGFNQGQLQSYADELGRTRRKHADAHADLFILTRAADRVAADVELETVRCPSGVRAHVLDFYQVAAQDERWEIISRSTDELVSPRQPVAGSPDVFLDPDIAKWAARSLRDVAQIGSEDRANKIRDAAKRQFNRKRLHGDFGARAPSFSVDKRNVEAAFFSYLDSEFARVEIDPLGVRDPEWGALVWAKFPKVTVNDGWMHFPRSKPSGGAKGACRSGGRGGVAGVVGSHTETPGRELGNDQGSTRRDSRWACRNQVRVIKAFGRRDLVRSQTRNLGVLRSDFSSNR